MSSSLPLDLELENFGWPEKLINSDCRESYNSIVDNTICMAIFLVIFIYCLIEIFVELIINELPINIFIPRTSLFNLSNFLPLPRLTTK